MRKVCEFEHMIFLEILTSVGLFSQFHGLTYFFLFRMQDWHLINLISLNKRPMGHTLTWETKHICSMLRLYHNVDLERKKIISFFDNWMVLIGKTLSHLHPGCFVPSFVEIGSLVLEKKMKMWKVYNNNNNNNNNNDNDGQRTNFDQKRSLEPLAQMF